MYITSIHYIPISYCSTFKMFLIFYIIGDIKRDIPVCIKTSPWEWNFWVKIWLKNTKLYYSSGAISMLSLSDIENKLINFGIAFLEGKRNCRLQSGQGVLSWIIAVFLGEKKEVRRPFRKWRERYKNQLH